MNTSRDDLINYHTAAAEVGLCVSTLRTLVARGGVPYIRISRRIVRFSRAQLGAWLSERTVPAAGPAKGVAR